MTTTTYPPPYGGRSRQDRIDGPDGPCCDKAWHLGGEPAPAAHVLRCAWCPRVYARCEACQRTTSTATSMRAHVAGHGRRGAR